MKHVDTATGTTFANTATAAYIMSLRLKEKNLHYKTAKELIAEPANIGQKATAVDIQKNKEP